MRDEDDRLALAAEVFEDAEQVIGLDVRQHACRLVEDQDIGLPVEHLEDFDPLLMPDREVLDRLVRVDVQLIFARKLGQDLARLAPRRPQQRAILGPQNDILEDGKILHQLETLEDHADPGTDRGLAVGDLHRLAADQDLARIGLVEAVENGHQRGFARAILADDAVDRAARDADRDILVRLHRAEGLADAAQLDRGGAAEKSAGAAVSCRPVV